MISSSLLVISAVVGGCVIAKVFSPRLEGCFFSSVHPVDEVDDRFAGIALTFTMGAVVVGSAVYLLASIA